MEILLMHILGHGTTKTRVIGIVVVVVVGGGGGVIVVVVEGRSK